MKRCKLPITQVYTEIMAVLDGDNIPNDLDPFVADKMRRMAYDRRKKILGSTSLKSAPEEFYLLNEIRDMKISLISWNKLDIHEKAKIIAHRRLKSMIEIIDAYYREQDDAAKERSK